MALFLIIQIYGCNVFSKGAEFLRMVLLMFFTQLLMQNLQGRLTVSSLCAVSSPLINPITGVPSVNLKLVAEQFRLSNSEQQEQLCY